MSNIIVFDVETTGTDKQRDQVIELCVQAGISSGSSSRGLQSLQGAAGDHLRVKLWRFRPSIPISLQALAVHGITAEDLAACDPFSEHADEVAEVFAGADVVVGYNMSFDVEMLQAEMRRAGLPPIDFRGKAMVDAYRLWQQCEPRSLLDAHRRFAGGDFEGAHGAVADVAATARVLEGMLRDFGLADSDWPSVAEVCEPERRRWIGPSHHIQWDERGVAVVAFGKRSGTALHELARERTRSSYLVWMLGKDFPAHVKDICKFALRSSQEDLHIWLRGQFGPPPSGESP